MIVSNSNSKYESLYEVYLPEQILHYQPTYLDH
jgi:hypothetical protein